MELSRAIGEEKTYHRIEGYSPSGYRYSAIAVLVLIVVYLALDVGQVFAREQLRRQIEAVVALAPLALLAPLTVVLAYLCSMLWTLPVSEEASGVWWYMRLWSGPAVWWGLAGSAVVLSVLVYRISCCACPTSQFHDSERWPRFMLVGAIVVAGCLTSMSAMLIPCWTYKAGRTPDGTTNRRNVTRVADWQEDLASRPPALGIVVTQSNMRSELSRASEWSSGVRIAEAPAAIHLSSHWAWLTLLWSLAAGLCTIPWIADSDWVQKRALIACIGTVMLVMFLRVAMAEREPEGVMRLSPASSIVRMAIVVGLAGLAWWGRRIWPSRKQPLGASALIAESGEGARSEANGSCKAGGLAVFWTAIVAGLALTIVGKASTSLLAPLGFFSGCALLAGGMLMLAASPQQITREIVGLQALVVASILIACAIINIAQYHGTYENVLRVVIGLAVGIPMALYSGSMLGMRLWGRIGLLNTSVILGVGLFFGLAAFLLVGEHDHHWGGETAGAAVALATCPTIGAILFRRASRKARLTLALVAGVLVAAALPFFFSGLRLY